MVLTFDVEGREKGSQSRAEAQGAEGPMEEGETTRKRRTHAAPTKAEREAPLEDAHPLQELVQALRGRERGSNSTSGPKGGGATGCGGGGPGLLLP